jgi:uncharacterized protein
MRPRISIITLASDDLDRSIRFYRDGLGLLTTGIAAPEHGGNHVLFEMEGGLSFVLFDRAALLELTQSTGGVRGENEVILSYPAESREEVDAILAAAEASGGTRAGEIEDADWGYHGHFRDPDGHLWEAIWFKPG